jgi:hypothetical protein
MYTTAHYTVFILKCITMKTEWNLWYNYVTVMDVITMAPEIGSFEIHLNL